MGKRAKEKKAASKGNVIKQVTCCEQLEVNFTGELWEAMKGAHLGFSFLRGQRAGKFMWSVFDLSNLLSRVNSPILWSLAQVGKAGFSGQREPLGTICRCWQWEGRH